MIECEAGTRRVPGGSLHPLGERFDRGTGRSIFVRIEDITYEERGEACNCRCPECETPFSAKLPSGKPGVREITPHFAHKAGTKECDPQAAYETAIHKIAKQIIKDAGYVWIPPVYARHGDQEKNLSKKKIIRLNPAEIRLERKNKHIQPDISAKLLNDNRILYIEIFVTHACDAKILAYIRDKKLATIEIDLSGLDRDMPIGQVENAIREDVLEKADREWLYNPRQAEVEAAMELAVRGELLASATALASAFRRPGTRPSDEPLIGIVKDAGLGHLLGGNANSCFEIDAQSWRATIISDLILTTEASPWNEFTVEELLQKLSDADLIKPEFDTYISPELAAVVSQVDPEFTSPFDTVLQLVGALHQDRGLDHGRNWWSVRQDYMTRAQRKRAEVIAARERVANVLETFVEIETGAGELFDRDAWMTSIVEILGASPYEVAFAGGPPYEALIHRMVRIRDMLEPFGPVEEALLGLPLETFREARRTEQVDAARRRAELVEANPINVGQNLPRRPLRKRRRGILGQIADRGELLLQWFGW